MVFTIRDAGPTVSGTAGTGYLKIDDLRKIVHNLGRDLSHRTVKELCVSVADPTGRHPDRVYYRDITDREIKEDE